MLKFVFMLLLTSILSEGTFLLHFIIIILSLIKLTGYFTSQALTYKPHDQFTGLY